MISPLLTDLYQLTMAYGYWKLKMHERQSVFQLVFRRHPFQGNYTVACGLQTVVEFIENWQVTSEDAYYLSTLKDAEGGVLFPEAFLTYLQQLRLTVSVDAIAEGTVVFPEEPLLRIQGPLLQCQLLESTLLNIINFQTLIATKAARLCQLVEGEDVLEFGLRRAQGPDGALSASRAAYIGGCAATSNVLAGQKYGIPVRGTHAHSWVSAFPDELTAFQAYAEVMPHNCVLLVDTFDTLEGVRHAIQVGNQLQERGARLLGIRLDSGDLAELSVKCRKMLDNAGFLETRILASNSLDEMSIKALREQGAPITVWGVGTHLATAYDHPALDGVYKLSALQTKEGSWEYKLKLSEQVVKISNPGIGQVRRYFQNDVPQHDELFDVLMGPSATPHEQWQDLLEPIFRAGQRVQPHRSIHEIRQHALQEVIQFCKLNQEDVYSLQLEPRLAALKTNLIASLSTKQKVEK